MLRDLRSLPAEVQARLAEHGVLDQLGVRAGRFLVEGGTTGRSAATGQRLEVRDAGSEQPVLDGYATVYDYAYPVMGGKASSWGWDETIVAGAAAKSVAERDDVYWLLDHEGLPVASTKARTLDLESDKVGLLSIARPDMRSQWNNEVVMRIGSDIDSMSFAFQVVRQEWNGDYTERFIREVELFDVSVVTYPASTTTTASLRSIEALLALDLSDATEDEIRRAVAHLEKLIAPEPATRTDEVNPFAERDRLDRERLERLLRNAPALV